MDTVTEARLAIAMAQEGGIGIIHKNLKPGAGARSGKVKRFESGVLRDPITIPPTMKVRDVIALSSSMAFPASRCGRQGSGRHHHQPRPALREELDARCAPR
jgi:IMP dehydrogenase/GMP reductase